MKYNHSETCKVLLKIWSTPDIGLETENKVMMRFSGKSMYGISCSGGRSVLKIKSDKSTNMKGFTYIYNIMVLQIVVFIKQETHEPHRSPENRFQSLSEQTWNPSTKESYVLFSVKTAQWFLKKKIVKGPQSLSPFHNYIPLEMDVTLSQHCLVLSLLQIGPKKIKMWKV